MLRVAVSTVPLLALRLREGAHYFQAGDHLLWGGVGWQTILHRVRQSARVRTEVKDVMCDTSRATPTSLKLFVHLLLPL